MGLQTYLEILELKSEIISGGNGQQQTHEDRYLPRSKAKINIQLATRKNSPMIFCSLDNDRNSDLHFFLTPLLSFAFVIVWTHLSPE